MCGICGIFSFDGPPPHRDLWPALVNHLRHRGPDEGAWWADGPFFLGHRRLAIIDLAAGGQPMATPDGELVVTFNGEIYNYRELRADLERRGARFSTDSDTEVILQGYRAWGDDLPRRLTGMFAFAIADRRRRELFLARDRFGEKPLFYWKNSRYLAFASELRPLTALPDLPRRIDVAALGGYLSLNYVPGTRTLLAGVQRLAPASWKLFSLAGERSGVYWTPPEHPAPEPQSVGEALEEWRARFDRAVKLALVSDVPVGIFLSGGMDSSLIAESATRQGRLSCAYFLDFEEQSYSEHGAAKTVADRLGLPLETVTLTRDDLVDFPSLVAHADDPLADSSALAVYVLSRLAVAGNKVVLGGDGGDELFGGYLTYLAGRAHSRITRRLPGPLRRALAAVGNRLPTGEKKVTTSYKLWRFLRAADLPEGIAHFTWNGTWLPDEAASFMCGASEKKTVRRALESLSQAHGLHRRWGLLDLQKADVAEYLPNDILTKVDRMSMAHGLETRAPFLEHEFASWALARRDELKIGPGNRPKYLLREAARRIFGAAIADRPKQGFSLPVHTWIRGPLAAQTRDLLAPASIEKLRLLDPARVTEIVRQHFSGEKSYGFELWGLLVLVTWHRLRVEHPPAPPAPSHLIERRF